MKSHKLHKKLVTLLLKDPNASEWVKAYANSNLEDIFTDILAKDGSVLEGILYALEERLDR